MSGLNHDGLKGYERRELEKEQRYLRQIDSLNQIVSHLGGIQNALLAPPKGDVLYQGTAMIGSDSGTFHMTWPEPYQAVAIGNTSPSVLTVVGGVATPSGSAPGRGAGIFTVPGGIMRTVSITSDALTVYGPPGTMFDLTVYSRPRDPMSGDCGSVIQPIAVAGIISGGVGHAFNLVAASGLSAYLKHFTVSTSVANTGSGVVTISGGAVGLQYILPSSGLLDVEVDPPYEGVNGGNIVCTVSTGNISGQYAVNLLGYEA